MRLLATSDLHYNVPRSRAGVEDVARRAIERGGDVLVVAGDIAGPDVRFFGKALGLFDDFEGEKLLVPGNHDLWVDDGVDSYEKWRTQLPELACEHGFVMLDHDEAVIGDVGFAGNVGWYDYSFRHELLGVPERFYHAKVGPGHAAAVEELKHLLSPEEELQERHYGITTAWRDRIRVKMGLSDGEFTADLAGRLKAQLERLKDRVRTIVTVLHHLPRRELVWYRNDDRWDFVAAFLGSGQFYEVIRNYPRVELCLSGHSHRADFINDDRCQYLTIGSTYKDKALLEFDI